MWAAEGFDWFDLESLEGQYCNQELDPLFCDPDEGDFNLLPTSPCRSYNHPCGVENGYSSGSCYPVAVPPGGLPVTLDLLAAPNPFNGRTVIHFRLPAAGGSNELVYCASDAARTAAPGSMIPREVASTSICTRADCSR